MLKVVLWQYFGSAPKSHSVAPIDATFVNFKMLALGYQLEMLKGQQGHGQEE